MQYEQACFFLSLSFQQGQLYLADLKERILYYVYQITYILPKYHTVLVHPFHSTPNVALVVGTLWT